MKRFLRCDILQRPSGFKRNSQTRSLAHTGAPNLTHPLSCRRPRFALTAGRAAALSCRRSTTACASLSMTATQINTSSAHVGGMVLTNLVRHHSDTGFTKMHAVQYVSVQAEELERHGGQDGGGDSEAHGSAASAAEAGADNGVGDAGSTAEPSIVDFTTDVAPEKLDRLYRRAERGTKYLAPPERRMFTKMLYEKFYKDESSTVMDPAMLYQASLEIQWIEEWMAELAREKALSSDDARREVKRALLERVDLQKPLSYIIGSQPFFGCDIHCEEPLLCPRPETEMWTHWLVYNYLNRVRRTSSEVDEKVSAPLAILDVCCGTGCIGVAIARHVPSAVVTALDILPQAVLVSQNNAQRNGVQEARYKAIQSDMFECFLEQGSAAQASARARHLDDASSRSDDAHEAARVPDQPLGTLQSQFTGTFDVVVSNPPYVLPNQYVELPRTITHWESKTALVGDDYRESRQYLYFKELCVHGAKLLKPQQLRPAALQGTPNMVIEVGLQAHMVADLMEKSGLWRDVTIHLDYAQQERWVSAVSVH